MIRAPVLVVGAGPTGLTLACELARRGVGCRVVDKAPELFVGSRAKGLQPRTLEVFDLLGVSGAIQAGGAPFPPFRLYAGDEVRWERSLEEMLGTPSVPATAANPHPRAWLIPQWRTDRILSDRFAALGGRVELSTEVTGIASDDDGVTVTLERHGSIESVRADCVVGADGGRSFLRKACGFAFEGETLGGEATLIGDVKAAGLSGTACHILTRAGDPAERFSLWNLPGSEHYQFVVTMSTSDTPDLTLASVQRILDERSGRSDIRLGDMRWISLYRVNIRMVDRLRRGRVFLAGDAAHIHSSAGGQGLNTGVQDAVNLGWKLASVLRGAPSALLDTYDEERLPVAASVLGTTTRLHAQGFGGPRAAPPAIHQLDITYRGSSLAIDGIRRDGRALRAGDRAADGVLPDGARLFDHFRTGGFTLLAFGRRETGAALGVREVLIDAPLEGYDVDDGSLVLVRPDGYVGIIARSPDDVRAYLSRVGRPMDP